MLYGVTYIIYNLEKINKIRFIGMLGYIPNALTFLNIACSPHPPTSPHAIPILNSVTKLKVLCVCCLIILIVC